MARIGFSTLGCPAWPAEAILEHAERWRADCLELRFIDGKIVEPGLQQREVGRIARLLEASPVKAETLATSVKLAHGDDQVRSIHPLLEIAAAWQCRRMRVFMGILAEGQSPFDRVRETLTPIREALDHAERLGVEIALETHDSVSSAADAARAVTLIDHEQIGVVWDIVHTARAGETPAASWRAIGTCTREVQVKDATIGKEVRPKLLDAGNVPWRDAVAAAGGSHFDGAFMLEWEKAWHPEIAKPETAIPHDLKKLRQALAG
jgi:sugar phosphate isomerase/epimerase